MEKSFLAPLYQSWSITNADNLGGFWMNLRQLEAFRAVMVTRSITQAAQSMHLSQPAVSKLIADLEYAIGFKLFVRSKGSALTVTPERSEEHTSELQSLMRNSYAVFCLKK